MTRAGSVTVLACVLAVAVRGQGAIEISLKHDSRPETQTKEQLQRLLTTYDLSRYIFTRSLIIDEREIPHSHPVLTLHARHLKDDDLLLSTFVHEQLHWFVAQKDKEQAAAIQELRVAFPNAPAGFPEGAADQESSYLHLLVCYLEQRAVIELLGELRARQIMTFWAGDHYRWVYRMVLERGDDIGRVMAKHALLPGSR